MKEVWKALFVTTLFMTVLSFLTMEKMSYIWTLRAVNDPDISVMTRYRALLVLLVSPYALALLQGLWNVSFLTKCIDTRLPPFHNIVLGVLSSILEAACLVWFTCLVAPSLPVFVLLPALSGVLSISILSPTIYSQPALHKTEFEEPGKVQKTVLLSRARQCFRILSSLGPVLATAVLYVTGCLNWLKCLGFIGTLSLLAIMWTPGVLYQTFSVDREITHNCRRLVLMYTILKIFSIFFCLLVDLVFSSASNDSLLNIILDFFSNFTHLGNETLLTPLIINIVAGIFSHSLAYLSLGFCQIIFGFIAPSVLSTVISTAICMTILGRYIYDVDELRHFGELHPLLLSGGILTCSWAVCNVFRALDSCQRPGFLFMPYEKLLLDYGWCCGFSDQRRLLLFGACGAMFDTTRQHSVTAKKSRVYVCTTMYREADYEMERLLLSLQKLSEGKHLKNVYLEAHIFMDNGINDTSLGDFAKQLIGLLVSRLELNLEDASCLLTPYGLQLNFLLRGGMPTFIHFKDPAKIKAKKRWSQCMYINYIMNFRKVLWQQNWSTKFQSGQKYNTSFIRPENYSIISRSDQSVDTSVNSTSFPTTPQYVNSVDYGPGSANISIWTVSDCTIQSSENNKEQKVSEKELFSYQNNSKPETEADKLGAKYDVICDAGNDMNTKPGLTRNNILNEFKIERTEEVDDDHTYILATDADMDFESEALVELLHMCNNDCRLGAACGRTHPVGKHHSAIVWHQIFEYAKDFWMIKSAQNVIGSVMCCPGCFSLYRASAIRQVMEKYATPTRTPFTVYVKDTGEDRWMATLMMINGWQLRYSAIADNTTYCPDTCQEFFKQRRRWILSDIANMILVVQNMPQLLRNNQCFSLVYTLYLLNMFMNNVITPGTAIVMITAGMELVFEVPYLYTTPPLTIIVYIYAIICTCCSPHIQTSLTAFLTLMLGVVFASVAIWGSYKIVNEMINEMSEGNFKFQQHYIILMLTISLLYAALIHPREFYQIIYGLAYLFIFPAMHLLLPIYSIANIIDQSWGTRDSQVPRIPKLMCVPNLKKLLKRRMQSKPKSIQQEDASLDIQEMIMTLARPMKDGNAQEQNEDAFWQNLCQQLLGNNVNKGLGRTELAMGLKKLRNRSLVGVLFINALWLAMLSYFYLGIDSPLSRLNLYGIISGALYGFTLIIQIIGMTVCQVNYIITKLARYLYGDRIPLWVHYMTTKIQ